MSSCCNLTGFGSSQCGNAPVRKWKFKGRKEPCIVYEIIDPIRVIIHHEALHKPYVHVKLQVIGYIPLEVLEPAIGHKDNITAPQHWMQKNFKTN